MNRTSIGWTDFTSNPIRYEDAAGKMVWACERTSPGCANCYAAELAKRYRRGGGEFTAEEMAGYTVYLDEPETYHMRHAAVIIKRPVKGSRIFIGDMTDIFGDWVPDDLLDQLFTKVLEHRTDVTWQLLTKRAERLQRYLLARWGEGRIPPRHIHIGVSVENQHFANERIPLLLNTPAAVRFISLEPLLGRVDLSNFLDGNPECPRRDPFCLGDATQKHPRCEPCGLHWGIVGGETGDAPRDPTVDVLVDAARQFVATDTPVFVKQDVGRLPGQQGRIPDDIWALKQFPKGAA